ncbi:uncharacterized protein LOC108681580 isoform X2 [Hyalella azteca]|uniref:Uncharacterized protein LOC108681580 isoform X2 n=1 Tax=Hyalella azteca TaxID=294128 RepID=A0A8B7PJE6_HYAAZ|nr:uncharacterized protein LOC108681580 isoform X2 [Hyalella azteca]
MEWDLNKKRGQMRLWGYKFPDLTSKIAPVNIAIVDLPLSVTKDEIAAQFSIDLDCITLKRKRGKKSASAIIVLPSWRESARILSSLDAVFFGKHKAFLRQSYDSDASRPSSQHYKPHRLSSEEFDLSPARSGQPTLHVLNDDVLLHIMKYLNVAEKLMLEAVCRRFQSLVYRELGQNNVIDFFTDDGCVWQSAHSNLPICRSESPAQLTQGLKLCTYKMLIMNANHLTTLRLDEYRCIFDVNVFAAIGRLAVNLEDLCLQFSLKRSHYTPMKTIFSRCTKLRTFCLEGRIDTDELLRDLQQCKCLEVLRLGRVENLNWALLSKLKIPLKELSIHNVETLENFYSLETNECHLDFAFNSSLTAFRMFNNILLPNLEIWLGETLLSSMARKCPALTQLQLDCSWYSSRNFKPFNNLKVLHFIASDHDKIEVLLKSALPDLEDLYIEFSKEKVYNMHAENEVLAIDFSLAPTSVTSLTLPSVALDDNSYKNLLRMPKLQRVFVKSKKFSMAQLKLLVAHVQLVEIGAAMLSVDLSTAQELAALRRKALAEGRAKFPSQSLDHDEPLVLHVNYAHHVAFADPLIKIKDHKLNSYIYERVGSCLFDNEWLDFGHDFLQQAAGKELLDTDDEDVPYGDMYDDWYDDHDDDFDDYAFSSSDHDDNEDDLLYGGHREY